MALACNVAHLRLPKIRAGPGRNVEVGGSSPLTSTSEMNGCAAGTPIPVDIQPLLDLTESMVAILNPRPRDRMRCVSSSAGWGLPR